MDSLPIEFAALEGVVSHVRQISENEYHSSCPNCGGDIHQDGTPPDRFVMWRTSKRGTPFGMCIRKCGYKWSPEKQDANWTQEERDEFRRKQEEAEADWMAAESTRIAALAETVNGQMVWKRYYDDAPESARQYYENERLIPRDWQHHLFLGYIPNYTVRGSISYKRGAYTIPIFAIENPIENIVLRVENPMSGNDRYRRLYRSKAQHLYAPMREKANKVVLMEGEFKAITGTIYTKLPSDFAIYGVQSKSPERRILKSLDFAEVVYFAFDPDAYRPDPKTGRVAVLEAAKQVGLDRSRFVMPPGDYKFDDAILRGYKFENAINMAVKTL